MPLFTNQCIGLLGMGIRNKSRIVDQFRVAFCFSRGSQLEKALPQMPGDFRIIRKWQPPGKNSNRLG